MLRTFLSSYFSPKCRRKGLVIWPSWNRNSRPSNHARVVALRRVAVGFSSAGRTDGYTGVASLRCQGPFSIGPLALRPGDGAHGVVEAHPQHLDEKVDGVAGQCALGPAPVALFEDQARMAGQLKVAGFPFEELQAAPLQEWNTSTRRDGHEAGA